MEEEVGGEKGGRGQWQAMAWAVLIRRASLHACARHEAAAVGRMSTTRVCHWGTDRRGVVCCVAGWISGLY